VPLNLRSIPLALVAICALVAACSSTEGERVVVDPNAPDISRGNAEPVPLAPAAEPSLLDPNRVVARVNDQIITVRSLNARYGSALRQLGDAGDEQVRQILDRFTKEYMNQVLVLEAAKRLGVAVTREDVAKQIARVEERLKKERDTTLDEDLEAQGLSRWEYEAQVEKDLITERLQAMLVGQANPVSAETRAIVDIWVRPIDVQEFYDRHREEFLIPENAEVEAIHIRMSAYRDGGDPRGDAEKAAHETVRRARSGEDFETLMKQFHAEPVDAFAKPFKRGGKPAAVEEFVWSKSTKPGQVSDAIPLRSSFLILKLTRRQEGGYAPFEEVREGIESGLTRARVMIARWRVQLELLRESVVVPRRFKSVLETQYRDLIKRQLEILAK